MTCGDCIKYKIYRGSRDRYGLQLEPDDADCTGNPTKEDYNRYFSEAEDGAEHCSCFRSRFKEDWE